METVNTQEAVVCLEDNIYLKHLTELVFSKQQQQKKTVSY